jgi:peptidoglycan/xylan/chitin deacetylase (PgdA/CDA1 family)
VSLLPIVTFHSLDESGSPISVDPTRFRREVSWLARHRFQTLTLSDGLAQLKAGMLAKRSIVLTFDDGFLNTLTIALPTLAAHGFVASVFVVTEYCGRSNDWPGQPPGVPRLPLMDWSGVNELRAAGWELGSHTRTHPDLCTLGADAARSEIAESRAAIEQRLGSAVATFAYPYGRFGSRDRAAVDHSYASAVTTRLGLARNSSDLLTLERVDAYYLTRPRLVPLLDSPLLSPYLAARQLVRQVRGRT